MAKIALVVTMVILLVSAFLNQEDVRPDTIYFASLNKAVQAGQYGAVTTVDALKKIGDFGLGTEEKGSSEMLLLDGKAYGIPADGKVSLLPDRTPIAYSVVKSFKADTVWKVSRLLTFRDLEKHLDTVIEKDAFAAIRIEASFNSIACRSYPEQQEPSRPADQVKEIVFEESDITGTLVGYYTPESAEALNSPRYHFHFIDRHRLTGGHVLDLVLDSAEVKIDFAKELQVLLPDEEILQ